MDRVVKGWKKAIVWVFSRFLSTRPGHAERIERRALQILAIVPQGPDRLLLRETSRQSGWVLTLSETPETIASGCRAGVPPIIIYDRELSPCNWREIVNGWTKKSPRPYIILLSPNTDANLWDEVQRIGGSDILHSPVNRDKMVWAIRRAWLVWRNQQQVRLPLQL